MQARQFLFNAHQQKRKKIECTELSEFYSKITDYAPKPSELGSKGSYKIICSDSDTQLESGYPSNGEDKSAKDSINDSDIIFTETSINRHASGGSGSMIGSEEDVFDGSVGEQESGESLDRKKGDTHESSKSWKMSEISESFKTSKSEVKFGDSLQIDSNNQDSGSNGLKSPPLKSPGMVKNIHAPISSSIFSQNHINQPFEKTSEKPFFSRQVSVKEPTDQAKFKKSKTLENKDQQNPSEILVNVLSPKKNYNLMDMDLEQMVKNRNIMDCKLPSNRSNLNNILKSRNLLKINRQLGSGVHSERLDSIKESSLNSGKEAGSSQKKSSLQKKTKEKDSATQLSQTLSHFQFEDHGPSGDPFTEYSKDDLSRHTKTDGFSEISGLQYLVNNKLSEQKEFLSGVGSLNNLTQYIDFPYLNVSKHASRLSKDFQTQDNISLFKDDIFQRNLEEITKHTGRLSIENFFSNIKKNQNFELIPDSKLECIQGPYFTGKEVKPGVGIAEDGKPPNQQRTLRRHPVHQSNPNLISLAVELTKSKKIIRLGHKKVESMRLGTLDPNGELTNIDELPKEDYLLNLKYVENLFLNPKLKESPHFLTSRDPFNPEKEANFKNRQDFSKQKKMKKSLQRAKSQDFQNLGSSSVDQLIDSEKKRKQTEKEKTADEKEEVEDSQLKELREKSDKAPGLFVPEGVNVDDIISIMNKDNANCMSSKNMLNANEMDKINEIMRIYSGGKTKAPPKKIPKRKKKVLIPKPSIDNTFPINPKEDKPVKETEKKNQTPKQDDMEDFRESLKLINSGDLRDDIQTEKKQMEETSIKDFESKLKLDFSDIEELDDTLINPLEDVLNKDLSLHSEEVEGAEEQGSGDKSFDGESGSEDEELDLNNPDFKFVDYLEHKTRKLYTKREIKANISWSSSEYDVYNPVFTSDEEKSESSQKSLCSDKFYLESDNEQEREQDSKREDQTPVDQKAPKKEKKYQPIKKRVQMSVDKELRKFKLVITENDSLKEYPLRSDESDSLIEINNCVDGKIRSLSSSPQLSKRSYVLMGSGGSEEETESKVAKTHDIREMLMQADMLNPRKNKHFISLKKIKEKGKVGIEKKWGQFLTRKVQERMGRDSEISQKTQPLNRPPLTNRVKKAKNSLNASLNFAQSLHQVQKINFSFHSRYKEEAGGRSVQKERRSKDSSLIRSGFNSKRCRSRKSSHCLKTGLFGAINNTDNIYSVQNRRVTMDSTDSLKNKSFFPNEHFRFGTNDQARNINNIQLKINSILGKTKSRRLIRQSEFVFVDSPGKEEAVQLRVSG